MSNALYGIDPTSYPLWAKCEYVICQTNGRALWEAMERLRRDFTVSRDPEPWPFPVNPDCKCDRCVADLNKEHKE